MKYLKLPYLCIAAAFIFFTGCENTAKDNTRDKSDFRMMIRLWTDHHLQPALRDNLLDAFRKYDFCDEVWLCASGPATRSLSFHEEQAAPMTEFSRKLTDMGIITSLQVVALGHGDAMIIGSHTGSLKDSTIHWGTMVGPDGETTLSVNCPRQEGYLECMEKAFVPYVEACRPHSLYLDDDLRMTHHSPAPMGCYCDTCISIFNKEYGYSYSRETLVKDLLANKENVRRQWIVFGQESLAGVVRAISRGVHRASPETRMGLQHASFHMNLLEGWDWNPMFRAMKEETTMEPVSRPGCRFYRDHAPRGMLQKGLDIARQIQRLEPGITEIAPEIEGYEHKATGKSAKSLCLETMYYLSMGATQMSYAIICANNEPMSWYADHYFKYLSMWKSFAKEYADFNKGTLPLGIDPYISPNLAYRDVAPGEDKWAWAFTDAANESYDLAALGFPFAPEEKDKRVVMLDKTVTSGMPDDEIRDIFSKYDVVVDMASWKILKDRGLTGSFNDVPAPDGIKMAGARYKTGDHRLAIVPSYSWDITGSQRADLLHIFDWASGGTLPAVLESMAQAAVVPRADSEGRLRSVALMNCSITDEDSYTLRLRPGFKDDREPRFIWKKQGVKDVKLKAEKDGEDYILQVPMLEGWNFGWIAVI